ncbi:MAG: hypothetical protein FWE47_00025 [Oscillospiraceae bacterium]|nr:hypothetical protein [Oscillospiraceae bacterium]
MADKFTSAQLGLSGDVAGAYDWGGYQGVVDYYNKAGDTNNANIWTQLRTDHLNPGNTISQMQGNSNAWGGADSNTQAALTATNQTLGNSIGATYDNGNWYNSSGGALYGTPSTNNEAWKVDASVADPYGIRAQYSQFGGDVGRAIEYYLSIGDLTAAQKAMADREQLGAYSSVDSGALQNNFNQTYANKIAQQQQQNTLDNILSDQRRIEAEQRAAQEAAIRAAVNNAVTQIEAQRGNVTSSAEQAGSAAYLEYMKALKRNEQQGGRLGLSGVSDFFQADALNSFQGAQAQIAGNRDKLMNDIELAITQARQSGDIQLANAIAEAAAREMANAKWGYTAQNDLFNANRVDDRYYADAIQASRNLGYDRLVYADERDYNRGLQASQLQNSAAEASRNSISSIVAVLMEQGMSYSAALAEAYRTANEMNARYPYAS